MKKIASMVFGICLAAGGAVADDDNAFVEFRTLKPAIALQAAQAAMEFCRDEGYQVGVTVVDRFGVAQVFLRDRFAGAHVQDTSFRKAWTSVTFRSDTTDLHHATAPGEESYGIRFLELALPLGGGVMIADGDGSLVAGIGVSGAPAPSLDDDCAKVGIAAIEDMISF